VEAGRLAFEAGGNAIDAAVAAQLMATVAEPLLTGLGGGGIALLRHQGQTRILDFFSDRPGLGLTRPLAPLEHIEVNFAGVDVQRFSYGVASVAVPGMIKGLWALHKAGGRLSLPKLARWAADQAERGLEVSSGLSKSIAALAPIIQKDEYLNTRLLVREADGSFTPAKAGHRYHLAELSETLMRWSEGGPDALFSGPPRDMLLDTLGAFAPLSQLDLERYEVHWRAPLERRLALPTGGDARIFTPRLPSQGGVQIAALVDQIATRLTQRAHARPAERLDPFGAEVIRLIAQEMRALEQTKGGNWPRPLTDRAQTPFWRSQLGFTTHISACDAQGTSVGITSSLGETAGVSVGALGLILNNFMGEEDVAPPKCMPAIGERLYTMCSPSLLEYEHREGLQQTVLGSGGSSRIRSVVAHGALYASEALLGLGADYTRITEAPRIHYEDGKLRLETFDRPDGVIEATRELCESWGEELVCFDDMNLFFGGLHIASCGALGLKGAGDPRRSGSVSFA
jgi:gamma-glutamyltranspeptidase/glutathione hydrolase